MTHQKEAKSPTPPSLQLEHHQDSIPSHVYNAYISSTLVPDRIPSQESPLSPEWIHPITVLLGHPLTSEVGQKIQKWIIYHANLSYTKLAFKWDPIQFEDNKHLQKYKETNGSISYLKSNTVKQLVSLNIYMILLICQDRPADQNYHPTHFITVNNCSN